jgi:hypothetical protein
MLDHRKSGCACGKGGSSAQENLKVFKMMGMIPFFEVLSRSANAASCT